LMKTSSEWGGAFKCKKKIPWGTLLLRLSRQDGLISMASPNLKVIAYRVVAWGCRPKN
jgi:hypothetical protein